MTFELDTVLLSRALEGHAPSLNDMLAGLCPHIERQLLRYPVADEDRRDLLQTTLLQVVRRLGSFRGDSSFSTWLFRVTANEALMMLRSQRRYQARILAGLDVEHLVALSATHDLAREQHRDSPTVAGRFGTELEEALAALSQDDRELLLARYQLDLNLPEIATRFALSNTAVRSRLHRIRGRLRSALQPTKPGVGVRGANAPDGP